MLLLSLLVIDDIWAIIWDTHPHPDEADLEGSPFHTIEVIDEILASDEHVAPLLAVNHTRPGGILNESGISTIYLEADFENESVERYWITVDTPREAVIAIEPVETFPSWFYPNIT